MGTSSLCHDMQKAQNIDLIQDNELQQSQNSLQDHLSKSNNLSQVSKNNNQSQVSMINNLSQVSKNFNLSQVSKNNNLSQVSKNNNLSQVSSYSNQINNLDLESPRISKSVEQKYLTTQLNLSTELCIKASTNQSNNIYNQNKNVLLPSNFIKSNLEQEILIEDQTNKIQQKVTSSCNKHLMKKLIKHSFALNCLAERKSNKEIKQTQEIENQLCYQLKSICSANIVIVKQEIDGVQHKEKFIQVVQENQNGLNEKII